MSANYPDFTTLSTKELLSITIKENCDSPVINELTCRFSSLKELAGATHSELTGIKGIGTKKASTLLASMEPGRRLFTISPGDPVVIHSPKDIAELVMAEMRYLDREHFRVALLNTKNHVLKIETVSIGTLNTSTVHPRELFKSAIKYSAATVILLHNHPSGEPAPSREDIDITNRLTEVGKLLGIEVLDHVVIGDGKYMSFKEKGLIP